MFLTPTPTPFGNYDDHGKEGVWQDSRRDSEPKSPSRRETNTIAGVTNTEMSPSPTSRRGTTTVAGGVTNTSVSSPSKFSSTE